MYRLLTALCFSFFLQPSPAHAWNAAGHRLVASIAWQQLSLPSQDFVAAALARHPDYSRWVEKAHSTEPAAIFAEASTWPDDIRHDRRFYNDGREPPTATIPGLLDNARHKRWHYVDLDDHGRVKNGELDMQIKRLSEWLRLSPSPGPLRSTQKNEQISYALPWLLHLVADIHQPLHVGRDGDAGGNEFEIENPFNKHQPFSNLHAFWDGLPGPSGLRGKRLAKIVVYLLERYPAPDQGHVRQWRDESHHLLTAAYPTAKGSLLPIVSEAFLQQAREITNRRIVEAGYRLGNLLENTLSHQVSHETP
ncbi:MAG: hypothetical protein CVU16_04980 [Betaproteobacteria bacterium HGW-Betaproteobacteria-10]|jgi:hypothetical protein|nr:MAG: hypothetical protein CVU16_04980 [Betaproteobacteria bacterium HGW-Betaproteobacteria-10]